MPLTYPAEMTEPLRYVLGIPNFACHPMAVLMRAAGRTIAEKAEEEQAVVLDWLVKIVLRHGENWKEVVQTELKALRAQAGPNCGPT